MGTESVPFEIEPLNSSDYKLTLRLKVEQALYSKILEAGLAKFNLQHKAKDAPNSYPIAPQYYWWVHRALKDQIKQIREQLENDKEEPIRLLNTNVSGGYFKHLAPYWYMVIEITGQYIEL